MCPFSRLRSLSGKMGNLTPTGTGRGAAFQERWLHSTRGASRAWFVPFWIPLAPEGRTQSRERATVEGVRNPPTRS